VRQRLTPLLALALFHRKAGPGSPRRGGGLFAPAVEGEEPERGALRGEREGGVAEEGAALLALVHLGQADDLGLLIDEEAGVLGHEDQGQLLAAGGGALVVPGEQPVNGG